MIQYDLDYDPLKDVAQVDQFGYLDLRKAYVDGTVTGDLNVDQLDYNDIDDPRAILTGKPRDVFDAIELGVSLQSYAANIASSSDEDNHD